MDEYVERVVANPHDQEAWNVLYLQYRNYLLKIIGCYVFQADSRHELLHDIWILVFRHIGKYDSQKKFTNWLGVVAMNACKSWLKQNIRNLEVKTGSSDCGFSCADSQRITLYDSNYDDNISPDPIESSSTAGFESVVVTKLVLKEAIACIENKEQLLAWQMKYMNGLTLEEISKVLQQPIATVKNWVYRVQKKIGSFLKNIDAQSEKKL